MKILFFVDSLNGETMGFIRQQIDLVASAYETHVITWLDRPSSINDSVTYHYLPYSLFGDNRLSKKIWWRLRRWGICDPRPSPAFVRSLVKTMHTIRPNLVHIQFATNAPIFFSAGHFDNIPIVIQARGYDVTSQLNLRPAYRRNLRKKLTFPNVHLVTVAKSLASNLKEQAVFSGDFHILRSLTDTSFFVRDALHAPLTDITAKRFVQIGSFRQKKGQSFALQAFNRFRERTSDNTELHFYGEGETKDHVRDEALHLGLLNKSVYFHSWVGRKEVKEILTKAHCAVHFAHTDKNGDTEGIPNFLMESMAMELPVVATRHAGIPELVDDSNGVLVNENDIEAAADAFRKIRDWKHLPHSRKKIVEKFSILSHRETLFSLYDTLIEQQETSLDATPASHNCG